LSVGNIERWERVVTYEKRKEEKSGAGGRGVRRRGREGRSLGTFGGRMERKKSCRVEVRS